MDLSTVPVNPFEPELGQTAHDLDSVGPPASFWAECSDGWRSSVDRLSRAGRDLNGAACVRSSGRGSDLGLAMNDLRRRGGGPQAGKFATRTREGFIRPSGPGLKHFLNDRREREVESFRCLIGVLQPTVGWQGSDNPSDLAAVVHTGERVVSSGQALVE